MGRLRCPDLGLRCRWQKQLVRDSLDEQWCVGMDAGADGGGGLAEEPADLVVKASPVGDVAYPMFVQPGGRRLQLSVCGEGE